MSKEITEKENVSTRKNKLKSVTYKPPYIYLQQSGERRKKQLASYLNSGKTYMSFDFEKRKQIRMILPNERLVPIRKVFFCKNESIFNLKLRIFEKIKIVCVH